VWSFVFSYEHEPIENVCNVSEVTAAHVHEASLINRFPEDKQLTSPHVFRWKVRVKLGAKHVEFGGMGVVLDILRYDPSGSDGCVVVEPSGGVRDGKAPIDVYVVDGDGHEPSRPLDALVVCV
jgi:hypothetical protein